MTLLPPSPPKNTTHAQNITNYSSASPFTKLKRGEQQTLFIEISAISKNSKQDIELSFKQSPAHPDI